jgi:anaerobic ribonucleoside-triphosphate reductase activating protein
MEVADLASEVLALQDVEGLTLSGGEPFDQAAGLAELVATVRESRDIGIVCYTGFTLEELGSRDEPAVDDLLGATDLLIDGPYIASRSLPGSWRGSDNQRLLCLTDRYADAVAAADDESYSVEVDVSGARVFATGDIGHSPLARIAEMLDSDYGIRL